MRNTRKARAASPERSPRTPPPASRSVRRCPQRTTTATPTYSLDDQVSKFRNHQIKTKTTWTRDHVLLRNCVRHRRQGRPGNTESNPTEDATIDVTINVTDVNEGPTFDSSNTATPRSENTATDTAFGGNVTEEGHSTDLLAVRHGLASFAIEPPAASSRPRQALDHEIKDLSHHGVTDLEPTARPDAPSTNPPDHHREQRIRTAESKKYRKVRRPRSPAPPPASRSVAGVRRTTMAKPTYSLDDHETEFRTIPSGRSRSKRWTETTQSYSVTVSVTDGIDDQGNPETSGRD